MSVIKIAYLAPELPSVSTTFIYNEILQLQATGVEVVPFSVHRPLTEVKESRIDELKNSTYVLYKQSKIKACLSHFLVAAQHPLNYLSALSNLFKDLIDTKILTRTSLGLIYRFFFAALLAKNLSEKKCQHLHVHFAHVPADIAMYATRMIGIGFSVTAHANDLFDKAWLLKTKVARSAFFVTISEFNKRFLVANGADSHKLKVIHCGVAESFMQRPLSKVPQSFIKIGLVSRLVEKKGVDTLIKAVKILLDRGIKIKVIIHGDGPLKQDLISLTEKLSLCELIDFEKGLSHNQVPDFITSLSAFVLPCKRDQNGDIDGIPVVLMEAMAMGIPVISTNVSGIPELIEDQVTGLLSSPDKPELLANNIALLVNNNVDILAMINNARSKIKKEFMLVNSTAELKDIIENSIDGFSEE